MSLLPKSVIEYPGENVEATHMCRQFPLGNGQEEEESIKVGDEVRKNISTG